MKVKRVLVILLGVLLFAGCVSSQKYRASLNDISNLKKDVTALEEKLRAKEAEKAGLESEISKLKGVQEELTKKSESENALRTKGLEDELKSKNMQIAELKTEIEGLSHERSKAIEEKEQAIAELNKTYTNLVTELNDEIKKGEIAVTQLRDKLSVSLVEKILFDSGSAEIKKDGKKVLDRVAEILKKISDKQIRIEGHTDNVPIGYRIAKKFSTNWELSTARATTVVRYLQEKNIDPKLLNPAGYAEYKPVESNDTEEGKARNRRIEIVLIPMDIDRLKR
ncbi:MAG: OmpA family protein [Nitrospirae bacterium]|nr:OmpA family protein [Nitrospirota bacterium]